MCSILQTQQGVEKFQYFYRTKIRILMSNVVSELLFGCESWRMTKGDASQVAQTNSDDSLDPACDGGQV